MGEPLLMQAQDGISGRRAQSPESGGRGTHCALGVSSESNHARTDDLLNRNPQGKRRTGIGWSYRYTAPTASHVVDRRRFAFEQCGNVRDGHDLVPGGIASWRGTAYFLGSLLLSNVRWHGMRDRVVYLIHGCSSQPHFLQYKKILKNYYVPLASASTSRANRIPGSSPIFRPLMAWPKRHFGQTTPVGGPPYGSNRRSLRPPKRGPFSNSNPLTCSDGRSEICGSPANISQGRKRFWRGASAPRTRTFWRLFPLSLSQE